MIKVRLLPLLLNLISGYVYFKYLKHIINVDEYTNKHSFKRVPLWLSAKNCANHSVIIRVTTGLGSNEIHVTALRI